MAELPLAIVGVAVAWKGIVDFASVIVTLCRNDSEDRGRLRLKAQCAIQCFKDWGERYEVESEDGIFTTFEDGKKVLIQAVMDDFLKENLKAMDKLKRYITVDAEHPRDEESFRRVVTGFKTQFRKGITKVPWNIKDRTALSEYVEEMQNTNDMLRKLTQFDDRWLQDQGGNASVSNNRLVVINGQELDIQDALSQIFNMCKTISSTVPPKQTDFDSASERKQDDELSISTKVANSVDQIDDFELMERVRDLAISAHYATVNREVCLRLKTWWLARSSIFKIEASMISRNQVCELTSSAFYSSAHHPKLIYAFRRQHKKVESESFSVADLAGMVYALIKQCFVNASKSDNNVTLDTSAIFADQVDINDLSPKAVQNAIALLEQLIVATDSDKQILCVVLDGLECLPAEGEEDVGRLSKLFISSIESACRQRAAKDKTTKVLFTCQGRGAAFRAFDGNWEVLNIMGESRSGENLMKHLPLLFA